MTATKYIELTATYNEMVTKATNELKEVTKGNLTEMGLVNNETRNSAEYKKVKLNFDRAFKMSQDFAKSVPSKIKREASQLRRASWRK